MAAEITAITGEVITPEDESQSAAKAQRDLLVDNERIVRRSWKAAEAKAGEVYRALTVIHTYDLWKLHKDDKGKRKYKAFDAYLFGEFGWALSRVRALQIIKQTRAAMVESGDLPAAVLAPRTRTAPEVTSARASKVTIEQFTRVMEAFATRVTNIDAGDPDKASVVAVYEEVRSSLAPLMTRLQDIVDADAADNEPEGDDEGDDADDAE